MYSPLLLYPFLFSFYLSDFIALCQLFIYFYKFVLAFFSTRLHYVHSMLGLWLAWVHKVYHNTKIFSKKVTFSNKWSLNSPFSCYTHSKLGLRLVWQYLKKVWVNVVNLMLDLRLTWLHKAYHKPKSFKKNNKIKSTQHTTSVFMFS